MALRLFQLLHLFLLSGLLGASERLNQYQNHCHSAGGLGRRKRDPPRFMQRDPLKPAFEWKNLLHPAWNETTRPELWVFNDRARAEGTLSAPCHRGIPPLPDSPLHSTTRPVFLLPQECHPVVLVLLAYHIIGWSGVGLHEVGVGNFEGQETLVPFRVRFSAAVGHCAVGVAETCYLADLIQEDGRLRGGCSGSELPRIDSVKYILCICKKNLRLKP